MGFCSTKGRARTSGRERDDSAARVKDQALSIRLATKGWISLFSDSPVSASCLPSLIRRPATLPCAGQSARAAWRVGSDPRTSEPGAGTLLGLEAFKMYE